MWGARRGDGGVLEFCRGRHNGRGRSLAFRRSIVHKNKSTARALWPSIIIPAGFYLHHANFHALSNEKIYIRIYIFHDS